MKKNPFSRRAKTPREVQEETQLYTFSHYCPSADVRPVGYRMPEVVAEAIKGNRRDCEAFLDKASCDEYNHSYRVPLLRALYRSAVASLNSQRLERERIMHRLAKVWEEDLTQIERKEIAVDEELAKKEAKLAYLQRIHSRGTVFEEFYKEKEKEKDKE